MEYDMCLGCVQEVAKLEQRTKNKEYCDKSCISDSKKKNNEIDIDETKLKTINFDENENIHEKIVRYEYDDDGCESDMMGFDLFG